VIYIHSFLTPYLIIDDVLSFATDSRNILSDRTLP